MTGEGIVSRLAALGAVAALLLPASANASQLIDRNAVGLRLAVSRNGTALLTYRADGRFRHVLAWGAVGARTPTRGIPQVRLRLDYSGGWATFGRQVWRSFRNACGRYDGPPLAWLVTACKAPDGSYWAVQRWRTPLPDLGFLPWLPLQRAWELHLSHWRGPLAKLEVWTDWVQNGRFHQIFGRLTYGAAPVYGFGTTRYGAPTDGYGRLVYLDTFNSRYGKGWRRENSFVSHNPTGVFCYTFYRFDPFTGGYVHPPGYPHRLRGPGNGKRYRLTVNGPGVTPDISWVGPGLPRFDPRNPRLAAREAEVNSVIDRAGDRLCRAH